MDKKFIVEVLKKSAKLALKAFLIGIASGFGLSTMLPEGAIDNLFKLIGM